MLFVAPNRHPPSRPPARPCDAGAVRRPAGRPAGRPALTPHGDDAIASRATARRRQIVRTDPPHADAPLANAEALRGAVAVVVRGAAAPGRSSSFVDKARARDIIYIYIYIYVCMYI